MGPLDFLTMGSAAPKLGQPLIKALLAKHGASLPELPAIDAAPKVGAQVGPDASPEARAGNVFDSLSSFGSTAPDSVLGGDGMSGIKASLTANAAKPRGFMDRIGDFLHSDEGRAEAMRFAAGAFKGGMGGGLESATTYADKRHHDQAAAASDEADRAMKTTEMGDNRAWHLGQLDNEAAQNEATRRHYERGDLNDSRRIASENYRHDTPSGDARVQSQTSIYTHLKPSGDKQLDVGEQRYEHENASGDTAMTQGNENLRNAATNQTAITTANIGHQPPRDTVHVRYQATPQTLGAQHQAAVAAIHPSAVKPAEPGDAGSPVHHVANDDQYNALPPGSRFMGPDGQVRVKP